MRTVSHSTPKSKPLADLLNRLRSPQNRQFKSIISALEAARNAIAVYVALANRNVPYTNSPVSEVCRDAEGLGVLIGMFVEMHGGEEIRDPRRMMY